MRTWFSDAPPLALALLSLSVVSFLIAATALYVPGVRTRFVVITSSYGAGRFSAGIRDSLVPEFATFAAVLAASAASIAADVAQFARPEALTARRLAEAAAAGLWAAAALVTLGGVTLVSALLAASLAFISALSDSFIVLSLSLLATLFDGLYTSGPQVAARLVFAVTYALYAAGTEFTRARPGINAVVIWAARMTMQWQAYAVLAGLSAGDPGPGDALYAATLMPAAVVLAYYAVAVSSDDLLFSVTPPAVAPQGKGRAKHGKRRYEDQWPGAVSV
jgi:hypothetical protein